MIWSQVPREMLQVLFFASWINSTTYIISRVRIVLSSHNTQIMLLVIHFLQHRHPHACWQVYKDAVAAWVLVAARWPALISCSPERWGRGSPGYCPLSLSDAWLVWKINTLTRAEVRGCTSSDMFISRWHTGFKGHHKSDILKWNNNIYVQIVCGWDHVEMVLIKLAYKWLPIYGQLKTPRLFTKCFLLTPLPFKY
jgi:hypothetical protein